VNSAPDWRSSLLVDLDLPAAEAGDRNPIGWAGYQPLQAVRFGVGRVAGHEVVACVWDFATYGGSFGEREAATVEAAAARAGQLRRPLLTLVRTGGTRLQEGVAALVGIARTSIALSELAAAGVPHIAIADHPTTGGVWVSVVSHADLRAGVAGATVGFSGPRVIEAMTGERSATSSHTAESATEAGLLDAVLAPGEVPGWLARALAAVAQHGARPVDADDAPDPPQRSGWEQVQTARDPGRIGGGALLDLVLDHGVELRAGDSTVRAVIGRSAADRSTIGVALAAEPGGRPSPAGFALLTRAAQLADRIGADLVTFVDTPGADPRQPSEDAGLAPAIAAAFSAVLECRSPTLAVVLGEGGSGGALAAAVADRVLVAPTGYFTALAPEGAAVALHMTPQEAADRGAITPADLLRLGFADGLVETDPDGLQRAIAVHLTTLGTQARHDRLAARRARWSGPLPGRC
jgi:acetyl-CoA carboxylase carboxyl transferase subunit beta